MDDGDNYLELNLFLGDDFLSYPYIADYNIPLLQYRVNIIKVAALIADRVVLRRVTSLDCRHWWYLAELDPPDSRWFQDTHHDEDIADLYRNLDPERSDPVLNDISDLMRSGFVTTADAVESAEGWSGPFVAVRRLLTADSQIAIVDEYSEGAMARLKDNPRNAWIFDDEWWGGPAPERDIAMAALSVAPLYVACSFPEVTEISAENMLALRHDLRASFRSFRRRIVEVATAASKAEGATAEELLNHVAPHLDYDYLRLLEARAARRIPKVLADRVPPTAGAGGAIALALASGLTDPGAALGSLVGLGVGQAVIATAQAVRLRRAERKAPLYWRHRLVQR